MMKRDFYNCNNFFPRFVFLNFSVCMWVNLFEFMCTVCVPEPRDGKMISDLLELEF